MSTETLCDNKNADCLNTHPMDITHNKIFHAEEIEPNEYTMSHLCNDMKAIKRWMGTINNTLSIMSVNIYNMRNLKSDDPVEYMSSNLNIKCETHEDLLKLGEQLKDEIFFNAFVSIRN